MSMDQAKEFIAQATQSLQSGQVAQALDLANQAIALDPNSAEAYILKGIASAQTNAPEAATDAFTEAIRLDPSSAKAYFNLSVHQYGLGQKEAALAASRSALEIDTNHAGARDMVARLESELGVATAAPASATMAPPAENNTPFGAAPQSNPQENPYYQSPYGNAPQASPTHSIPFVENMGATWTTLGWILVALGLVFFVANMATSWGMVMEAFSNPEKMQGNSNPFAMTGRSSAGMIISLLAYIPLLGSLVWMCMDIADRRNNWVWLVPYILCCCCGVPYIVQGIYMLTGRNK